MSSPLSELTCLRTDGRTCWIRIEPLQALSLPYSDAFALATLLEVFGGIVHFRSQVLWEGDIGGPLSGAIETDTGLSRVDAMLSLCDGTRGVRAIASRYVSLLGYRDVAGFTVPPGLRPNADGLYAATHWWRDDRERQDAHRAVSEELSAWYTQYYDHEEEGAPPPTLTRPTVTMVMEAARPEWLAHMRAGMSWAGYCYDDDAPSFP
jgi:hypothetical protein